MKLLHRLRSRAAGRIRAVIGRENWEGPRLEIDAGLTTDFRSKGFGVTIGGDENDLSAHLGLHWFSAYLSVRDVLSHDFKRRMNERAERRAEKLTERRGQKVWSSDLMLFYTHGRELLDVSFHDGSIWVHVWNDSMCWNSGDTPGPTRKWVGSSEDGTKRRVWTWQRGHLPWNCSGWTWSLNVKELLLGEVTYEEIPLEVWDSVVRMPEGEYPCQVRTSKVRWTHSRAPFSPWYYRAMVDIPNGIPFAGKGENSWDCDDDALNSITFGVESEEPWGPREYTNRAAVRVFETRLKRSSPHWTPNDGWPAHCMRAGA